MNDKIKNEQLDSNIYAEKDNNANGFNKFFSVVWKILLVTIVFSVGFLLLIQFNVLTLTSNVLPEVLSFNQTEIGLKKGKNYQLVTTILPENATNKQIVYSSSDPEVAIVNEITGYITALKEGVAKITAKTLINGKETECIVNVGNIDVAANSLAIKQKKIDIASGHSSTIQYTLSPPNATNGNVNFTSSDTSVAAVDSNGNITALKEGTAVIKAETNNGILSDETYVTVYKKGEATVVNGDVVKTESYPDSITIPTDKSLTIGSTVLLEPNITPNNATSIIEYSSTNSKVATVSSDGVVTAVGIGSADIIARTINNLAAKCHVTVGNYNIELKNIYITTRYSFLQVGMTKKLYVSYEPINASNPTVTFTSSNPNIVSVDNSGNVLAKNIGKATITVKSQSSNLTDTMEIEVGGESVVIPLTSLSIGKANREVYVGSTELIKPSFTPTNTTYTSVTYSSSDTSVATVDSSGQVRGIKEGKATITVRVNRSNILATTTFTVKNNPATSVELSKTSLNLKQSETDILASTVLPANASNKTVTYISSDTSIATVDNTGKITAINKGTTTITVKPNGGGQASTCIVTVS